MRMKYIYLLEFSTYMKKTCKNFDLFRYFEFSERGVKATWNFYENLKIPNFLLIYVKKIFYLDFSFSFENFWIIFRVLVSPVKGWDQNKVRK